MHPMTHLVTIVLTINVSLSFFYETKLTSFSVLEFPQSYIGKFIVLLGTSVMSVGLAQILSY